jgi:peptidoglycan/LPS O-acetylase OafA/YrhL
MPPCERKYSTPDVHLSYHVADEIDSCTNAEFVRMANDRHIPSLDGLRGVSIALVILAHLQGVRGVPAFLSARVFDHGLLGVKVFFVVSGFLITRLIADEMADTGRLSLKLFYIRRVLRIFPAFYLYLGVVALASALHWLDIPLHNLAFAGSYTINYIIEGGRWETGHLWSLAIEEQFYLIWPFTIVMLGLRRALGGAAALAALAPYALLALFLHGAGRYMLATRSFPFAFDAIAAGCVLGGALELLLAQPAFLRAIASPYGGLVPPMIFVLDLFPHNQAFFHAVAQPLITIGICYGIARYTQVVDSFGAHVLAWRPLVWVGKRSYSLYLWQQLFIDKYFQTLLQTFPLNIALAVACANASYTFIERPLNRLRARYRPTPRAVVAPTEPALDTSVSPAASRI